MNPLNGLLGNLLALALPLIGEYPAAPPAPKEEFDFDKVSPEAEKATMTAAEEKRARRAARNLGRT